MRHFIFFIIFAVFYSIFNWIIKKTDIHNKLFNKAQKYKYIRIVLILSLIVFFFFFEYAKRSASEEYGKYNYISIIIAAFLGPLYLNFAPIIFKRNNQ